MWFKMEQFEGGQHIVRGNGTFLQAWQDRHENDQRQDLKEGDDSVVYETHHTG